MLSKQSLTVNRGSQERLRGEERSGAEQGDKRRDGDDGTASFHCATGFQGYSTRDIKYRLYIGM